MRSTDDSLSFFAFYSLMDSESLEQLNYCIYSKFQGTVSFGQDNYMEEIADRYQLYSPATTGLVLRLAGVKGCCCPAVNVGRGRKPQHPIWKLKIIGMCYLGRTPTSCLQKVSSCLAPRSYPNERQTLRSCQEVF